MSPPRKNHGYAHWYLFFLLGISNYNFLSAGVIDIRISKIKNVYRIKNKLHVLQIMHLIVWHQNSSPPRISKVRRNRMNRPRAKSITSIVNALTDEDIYFSRANIPHLVDNIFLFHPLHVSPRQTRWPIPAAGGCRQSETIRNLQYFLNVEETARDTLASSNPSPLLASLLKSRASCYLIYSKESMKSSRLMCISNYSHSHSIFHMWGSLVMKMNYLLIDLASF